MSKLNRDQLRDHIRTILEASQEKDRKFTETIELQVGLKGFDPARDKRLNANVLLPQAPKTSYKICLFGNENQCDEAAEDGIPHKNMAELKAFKRNKKLVKKMAKSYDAFVASSTLLKKIPRLLGPTLQKLGKFPFPVGPGESVAGKVEEVKRTVKGAIKFKVGMPMCMSFAVANVTHTEDEIELQIITIMNYLTSIFKKGWQNVKRVHIKTTMGAPVKIYGF